MADSASVSAIAQLGTITRCLMSVASGAVLAWAQDILCNRLILNQIGACVM